MTRLALSAWLLVALPAWGLDLTPIPAFRQLEGIKIPVLHFSEAGRTLCYQPPAGWRASGSGKVLQLTAPGAGQNRLKLMLVQKPRGTPAATELTSETVLAIARVILPKDASSLMMTRETPSPFALEGRPSLELSFSYTLFSQRELAAVAVVDRSETEWFVLFVSASPEEFDSVHSQAVRSMFTWRLAKN